MLSEEMTLHMLERILIQMDTEEKRAPDRTAKGLN